MTPCPVPAVCSHSSATIPQRSTAPRDVELTLKTPRYGCLEINYDSPDLPRATVYIFADAMEKALSGNSIRVLEPGFHSRKELEGVSEECFDFAPGLHEFEGGKLHLQ